MTYTGRDTVDPDNHTDEMHLGLFSGQVSKNARAACSAACSVPGGHGVESNTTPIRLTAMASTLGYYWIRKLNGCIRKLGRLYSEFGNRYGTVVFGNWRDLGNYEEQHQTLHGNNAKLQGIDFFAQRRLISSV